MSGVYSWIKNIIVFLLIITILDQVLPSSTYKKYIKVSVGMVLILLVFLPVLDVFNIQRPMDYYYQLQSFRLNNGTDQFDIVDGEKIRKDMVIKEYKKTLIDQMNVITAEFNYEISNYQIDIEEDETKETYGTILNLSLELTEINKSGKNTAEIYIEPIDGKQQEKGHQINDEVVLEFKNKLANYYQISLDHIVVIIN